MMCVCISCGPVVAKYHHDDVIILFFFLGDIVYDFWGCWDLAQNAALLLLLL
jgi:hypothetical protein